MTAFFSFTWSRVTRMNFEVEKSRMRNFFTFNMKLGVNFRPPRCDSFDFWPFFVRSVSSFRFGKSLQQTC